MQPNLGDGVSSAKFIFLSVKDSCKTGPSADGRNDELFP